MKERRELIIDHLGSPIMVVKYFYDTEVAKELKYNSFGQVTYDSAPDFDFPFRFAGGIWDEDTKLIRFGVRDYDPETGRWTSVEPLGFAGSRNWYVYAGNDGVNFVDLDGNKVGRNGEFIPGEVWGKRFPFEAGNEKSQIDAMEKAAFEALQDLICVSLYSQNEWGFSLNLRLGMNGQNYIIPTNPHSDNNPGGVDVIFKMGGGTLGSGHTHMNDTEYKAEEPSYSKEDPYWGDYGILRKMPSLKIGYIATINGNFIWYKLNNGSEEKGYLTGYHFDFSKCICKE